MKKIILSLSLVFFLAQAAFSQSTETFVYDSLGNAVYVHARAIVSFHPDILNLEVIDDTTILSGTVSEFVNPEALPFIESEYGGIKVADLKIIKIFKRMRLADSISISRLGETIDQTKHWATLLIEFPSDANVDILDFCDSARKFFPLVAYAHPDFVAIPATTANDTLYKTKQHSLHLINNLYPDGNIFVEGAWNLTTGDTLIRTGIFDSGIQWGHEDFGSGTFNTSKVKGGFDYVNNQAAHLHVNDALGHGTKTAGIIGAIRNNDKGVAGIAGGNGTITTGTSLYSMKITKDDGSAIPISTIANAIVEGSAQNTATKFGYGLHVMSHGWYIPISNPFYTQTNIDLLRDAMRTSFRNKVISAVARGNEGNQSSSLPATLRDEWSLTVGAHDENGNRASFSSYGQGMDILAPGTINIVHTTNNQNTGANAYTPFAGTSASTPHAAGVAALMLSHVNTAHSDPNNLAPEDVENLIQMYARDLTDAPYSTGYDTESGWGRLHADSVVSRVHKPYYTVFHFGAKNITANNTNSIPDTTIQVIVTESNGQVLPAGVYPTVNQHKFSYKILHSIPKGHQILGAWARNSSSKNLWQFTDEKLSPEVELELTNITHDSVRVTGYIYNFTNTTIGGFFRSELWQPTSLNGVIDVAYSIYTFDPLANAVKDYDPINFEAKLYPNPAQNEVKVWFILQQEADVWFEITDIQGKTISKTTPVGFMAASNTATVPTHNLPNGMYFLKVCSQQGYNTHKLLILN